MLDVAITCSLVANGGDAAILVGTLRVLREAFGEVHATVYDLLPDVARRHYPELEIEAAPFTHVLREPGARRLGRLRNPAEQVARLAAWSAACRLHTSGRPAAAERVVGSEARALLDRYSRHDLSVASGGTYLVETYALAPHFVDLGLAHRLDVPQALLTQSLGPFTQSETQRGMRRLIRETDLTLLRDARSRRHLAAIDADGPGVHVGADTAFALADPVHLAASRDRSWPTDRAPRIGISVRDWAYFASGSAADGMARYGAAVRDLATHLVETHGAHVVFVSTCQGNAEYHKDDAVLAARWVARLPASVQPSVTVDTRYHRPDALLDILGDLDLVVSTRMHVAILSLCAGTPVLPISYEFKTDELFAGLGVPEWVENIDTLTGPSLVATLDRVLTELPARRADVVDATLGMHLSALHDAAALLREAFPRLVANDRLEVADAQPAA